jgi:hypothetical protein
MQRRERRALFDGELIKRQMLRRFRDRGAQLRFPGLKGLARSRIDQIERRSFECRLCDADGGQRFGRGMPSSEPGERGVVERLNTERNAIDAGRAKTMEPLCLTLVGLASRVISAFAATVQWRAIASSTAATVAGCISDGVPPPMKIVDTVRAPMRAAVLASSVSNAAA